MILYEHIAETAQFIQSRFNCKQPMGIVLGTGLGELAKSIEDPQELSYAEIPNFPQSTVEGHDGKLIHGRLAGKEVLAMKGRFHFYEGYSMQQVVFPIKVMQLLGVKTLLLSNASGGMNASFKVGDIMIIRDHINLFPTNPLIGANDNRFGPRFVDMSEPYDKAYITLLQKCGRDLSIELHTGVYAGLTGPCFETPAEYRFLSIIGADVVGMSTVPETISAKHMGMRVAAISVVTDLGIEGHVEQVSHEEVQIAARAAEPKVAELVIRFLKSI